MGAHVRTVWPQTRLCRHFCCLRLLPSRLRLIKEHRIHSHLPTSERDLRSRSSGQFRVRSFSMLTSFCLSTDEHHYLQRRSRRRLGCTQSGQGDRAVRSVPVRRSCARASLQWLHDGRGSLLAMGLLASCDVCGSLSRVGRFHDSRDTCVRTHHVF